MAKHRLQRASRSLALPGAWRPSVRRAVLAVIVGAGLIVGIIFYTRTGPGARADIAGAAGPHRHAAAASGHHVTRAGPGQVRHRRPAGSPAQAPAASPTASPAAPPPAGWHPVHGSSVTAIGDSVMVASTPALQQALPGIYIDAQVGRQFYTGLSVIEALKQRGLLRPIVVVGLGTNGTVTWAEIRQLFAEIGRHRKVVLINTFEDRSWEAEVNATLAAAARYRPDAVLANWHATIAHRTYLLWSDGIHPQPAGGLVYARMLKAAVEKAGNLPSPPARTPRIS